MVKVQDFIKTLNLQVLSPTSREEWDIPSVELNRPGLQFVGFYEHFAYERPQVVGLVEMTYLESLSEEDRRSRLEQYFSYPIPCVIFCRGMMPTSDIVALAKEHDVALLRSEEMTTKFTVNAMNYLNRVLAPRSTLHGVLVDVYGVGILITGESGVGKSETALELVKRGHQLVADDVVDISKVNDKRLVGESPETIRHFMEIRGIGIIDIRAMYGIGSVMMSRSIDLVIHLEHWKEKKAYDRLGLSEDFTTIMDVRIPQVVLPVRPGRNLAIIIEVAARNFSLKRMGYSAAKELDRRLNEMMGLNMPK
ncbi:MAG: HPr kinase/phosphorylase [Clostridia bacterium]|nr:HPr kinase/phosphorylase [Clostridia bacterium]MBR6809969.1 HPr kinase/phosphorylase [Clostridia bacterium]